jgi:hypothetical protein
MHIPPSPPPTARLDACLTYMLLDGLGVHVRVDYREHIDRLAIDVSRLEHVSQPTM